MQSLANKKSEKIGFSVRSSALGRFCLQAVDLLLPPRCLGTGEIVDSQGMITPACWSQLNFIDAPYCNCCGLPFSFGATADMLCAACLDDEPQFDTARACVIYNDISRQMILDFKYGDRLHAVDTFLPWLQRAGAGMLAQTDIIVPVPLHARRLWQRRFNQSALLAQSLARHNQHTTYLPDGLMRKRHTLPQKGLSRKERHENVKNAFAVAPRHTQQLSGKTVMIVDDVYTSGATLNECARILKKAGAAQVFVLTIARVTLEEF